MDYSTFAKPEKPLKLSQFEIMQEITGGTDVFCGRCGQLMILTHNRARLNFCNCLHTTKIENYNSISSLRIVNGKILSDYIIVSDEEFDPEIHSPSDTNHRRLRQWHSHDHEKGVTSAPQH